jgi:ribonuclease HI
MKKVICYTGGKTLGNPGPAAIGVYITDEVGVMLGEVVETIGNSTDTFAEYQAVLTGLQTLKSILGDKSVTTSIEIRLESELVKKQLNAELEIKEPGFVPMFIEIHNIRVVSVPNLTFALIPSADNKVVKRLLNEALETR